MDELGKWLLEVITAVNGKGRLGPPVAIRKRVSALLEEIGGEGIFKLAADLNVSHTGMVRQLASAKPDLGQWLVGTEPQTRLDIYFQKRDAAWEPFRNYVTRGLSLPEGQTTLSFASPESVLPANDEAWEKVFQIFFGGNQHGQ
jgi:hypothetical protein